SITEEAAEYLKVLVRAGYNIFVSGGTGVGKTTFLNVLSDYIPPTERVITIEDSAELQISNIPNLVRLEMRNANVEGNHAVTIRDLIKTSLRMRPSRIIVGEVRDAASIDMLQSLNTGHNGMSTGHANSPADMLSRLETMALLGEEIPLLAIRKQIASAIDIIIQLGRLRDRTRRVTEIVEVEACVDGEIVLNPLFRFEEEGEDGNGRIIGTLRHLGNRLKRRGKLAAAGEEQCLSYM
ncbi:MAG: CpaF family protein, partial [Lachnospiraceae bacterium]|nr:CpaF family protein [Lachnospiraceae bacterium]